MEGSMQKILNNRAVAIFVPALMAVFVPALIGLVGTAFSVRILGRYGWSLFLGLPLLVSFLSSFAWSFKRMKTFGSAYGISVLSILALGGFILLFALDGLVCLLMALPLALVLALLGTALGRVVGASFRQANYASISCFLCVGFPLLVGFEHVTAPEPIVREVTSSVVS